MEFEFQFQEGSVCFWRLLRRASFCWPYYALMGVGSGTMALCPFLERRLQWKLSKKESREMICCKHDTLQVWRVDGNCLGSAW